VYVLCIVVCPFVLFHLVIVLYVLLHLVIVLYVLLRFTDYDNFFGIFKLFILTSNSHCCWYRSIHDYLNSWFRLIFVLFHLLNMLSLTLRVGRIWTCIIFHDNNVIGLLSTNRSSVKIVTKIRIIMKNLQ
jgi:hypothetical protein